MVITNLELLERVLRDPVRLLGEKSIKSFEAFQLGYSSGKSQGTFQVLTTKHLKDFLTSKYQFSEEWPYNRSALNYLKFFVGDDGPGLERYAAVLKEFYSQFPKEQSQPEVTHEVADFAKWCEGIRQRPAMYFGNRKHLTSLVAFFNGRIEAERERNGSSETAELMSGFQRWLNVRLPWSLDMPWERVLLFYNLDMEDKAFREFWVYLQLFQDGESADAISPVAKDLFESDPGLEKMTDEQRSEHKKALNRIFH